MSSLLSNVPAPTRVSSDALGVGQRSENGDSECGEECSGLHGGVCWCNESGCTVSVLNAVGEE